MQWRCQDWSPKAGISGRAGADQKYFRKEKKNLTYSDHSGYTYLDQEILIVEATGRVTHLLGFINSVEYMLGLSQLLNG